MTVLYAAGFQVGGTNTMAATVAGSAATIASGLYLPGTFDTNNLVDPNDLVTANWTLTDYTAFTTEVKTRFDAATSDTFTVSFSLTTGKYTISRGSNFTLTFTSAPELRLRAALGFTGNKSGASTYTSDFVPWYVMLGTNGARTFEGSPDYQEPDDIADETVDDGGTAEVITRKTLEHMSEWSQTFEPRTQTFRARQTTGGWTWEHFLETTRGTHPFACYDANDDPGAGDGYLYRFTAKGAAFRPERATSDFSDYWHIRFKTRILGYFA